MNLYVIQAYGAAFYGVPLAVATTFDRALALALEAAPSVDKDGYHNIEIWEVPADTLCIAPSESYYSNATTTARQIGTLERSKENINGVWELR